MKLQNGGEYMESLRALNPVIYYKGKRIDDVTRHPATAPHVRAAAMTYSLAAKEKYRELATAIELSPREFELLRVLGAGMSLKECASHLHISTSTASTYRTRLMEKLKLRTTAEIIRFALENFRCSW